jgi:hypothetical protein
MFGLGGTAKALTACVIPGFVTEEVLAETALELRLESPGKGIAFTIPLSGIVGNVVSAINGDCSADAKKAERNFQERMEEMKANMEKIKSNAAYCMVVASVNQGFSEAAATAAHEAGARGGSTWTARKAEVGSAFGLHMAFQSEREILVIISPKEKKLDIMKAINTACGMKTEAEGVVLSLPVDYVMGLRL